MKNIGDMRNMVKEVRKVWEFSFGYDRQVLIRCPSRDVKKTVVDMSLKFDGADRLEIYM